MPSNVPTGYETYIYDHKEYPNSNDDRRQFQGALHDVAQLPPPECSFDTAPLIMVEPSYRSGSDDVFLYFPGGHSMFLSRIVAEQLRDALIKACNKPLNCTKE